MFALIDKTPDFCGKGLLPNELSWNKFIFKSWATWTAQCRRTTAARLNCSHCPRSGSYVMLAKMRLWSACIKLSSIQGWIIYLYRPVFLPPGHIVSLEASQSPAQFRNNGARVTFHGAFISCGIPSLNVVIPLVTFVCQCVWKRNKAYL